MLEDAVKKSEMKSSVIAISREPWGTGQPGESPVVTRKSKPALNALNDAINRARKVLEAEGQAAYELHAKAICRDFRIMGERLVEESLLNGVVLRFRRSVGWDGRIRELGKIQPADCKLIEGMMAKYSRYEHSQPDEAPVALPTPDELAEDVNALLAWLDEFAGRKMATHI
jgi:hypothetical protein